MFRIRYNLDPFDESSDEEIWRVLEDVHLKEHILSLPKGLNDDIVEGGDNLSVGQRQLICIGKLQFTLIILYYPIP